MATCYINVFISESVLGEESDEVYNPEEQLQQAAQRELIREVAHILQTLGDRYSQEHHRILEVRHILATNHHFLSTLTSFGAQASPPTAA